MATKDARLIPDTRNNPLTNPVTKVKAPATAPQTQLFQSPSWTDTLSVPIRTPMFDDLESQKLSRTWMIFFESLKGGGGAATGSFLPQRTLDLKDTTVGNDIGDATVVYNPGTVQFAVGTLRKAVAADLIVRTNVWVNGVSAPIGTFTIPHATLPFVGLEFTTFTTTILPFLSVITWDVVSSSGEKDPGGIAAFSLIWQ